MDQSPVDHRTLGPNSQTALIGGPSNQTLVEVDKQNLQVICLKINQSTDRCHYRLEFSPTHPFLSSFDTFLSFSILSLFLCHSLFQLFKNPGRSKRSLTPISQKRGRKNGFLGSLLLRSSLLLSCGSEAFFSRE